MVYSYTSWGRCLLFSHRSISVSFVTCRQWFRPWRELSTHRPYSGWSFSGICV